MRLLIIEDEYKLARLLQSSLAAEQYVVDVCYDGQEGYEQASVEEYDLIILDLGLPGMDGLEVCRQLREDEVKTPVLMLTARDTTDNKVTGLDAGADDYLVKPFSLDELLARVRALLRRGEGGKAVLSVDSLSLDPSKQLVTRAGELVTLSAREYALLEYLLRHPDKIISKSSLLDHVWGAEVDLFSNVVDVYIGYLRKKINTAFPQEKPLLQTVKGRGYRLLPLE